MDFDLDDTQRAIRDAFARFVDDRVVPQAAALDEARAYPRELMHELARLGLFGMRYPQEAGGSGLALLVVGVGLLVLKAALFGIAPFEFLLVVGLVVVVGFASRKRRAPEALAYNALVQSWPGIVTLAKEAPKGSVQAGLFDTN